VIEASLFSRKLFLKLAKGDVLLHTPLYTGDAYMTQGDNCLYLGSYSKMHSCSAL
jgi:hypothetical protein